MSNRFSFSNLNTYKNCPYKYDLRYNKMIFVDSITLAGLYGTLIHKIEERIFNYILAGKEIPYEELKEDFLNYNIRNRKGNKNDGIFGVNILKVKFYEDWCKKYWKTGKNYEDKSEEYLTKGIYWLENFLKTNPHIKPFKSEMKFEFEYKNNLFFGAIDRTFYNSKTDSYIVQDIKTKENEYSDKDLTDPLQFIVYKKAIENELGANVKVDFEFYLPTLRKTQKAKFTKNENSEIDNIIKRIKSGNFDPHMSVYCRLCEYKMSNKCKFALEEKNGTE